MSAETAVILVNTLLALAPLFLVIAIFCNSRRRKFRRLMKEFETANKKHNYYMAEGDLPRAKEQLDLMGRIVDRENGLL